MWHRVGHCNDARCGERFWHAGLSEDGSKCFIAKFDDNVFSVWDIQKRAIVWRDDCTNGSSSLSSLQDWMNSGGIVQIEVGPAAGCYRIFGLDHNHAKTRSNALDQELNLNSTDETLLVQRCSTGEIICELKHEVFSGDWAFASFSENDATIAVLEPYNVTFFSQSIEY